MKTTLQALLFTFTTSIITAQVNTPQPSPFSKLEQVVGLTKVAIEYSRPAMRGRRIFGELVPYDKLWRTGANNNTMITFEDDVNFAGTSVKSGTYAIFTKPSTDKWEVILYSDTKNWGTPSSWNDSKVIAKAKAKVFKMNYPIENFTISITEMNSNGAKLSFLWENTYVEVPFTVPTDAKTMKSIKETLAKSDVSSDDYMKAAEYYYESDKDITQAKKWIDKAVSMKGKEAPFWYLRRQSLIYAKSGSKKNAIKIAKKSLKLAKKAGNRDYIKMNENSIKEWSKK